MPKVVLKIDMIPPSNPITPPAMLVTLQDTVTHALEQEQITFLAAEFEDPSSWLDKVCELDPDIVGCPV